MSKKTEKNNPLMSGQIPHVYKSAGNNLDETERLNNGEHLDDTERLNNGEHHGEVANSSADATTIISSSDAIDDSGATTVLDGVANQIRAEANATTVINLDADATTIINDANSQGIDSEATTIISEPLPADFEEPFQNGMAEVLPDSAFEPKTHSQVADSGARAQQNPPAQQPASPSYTSVLPAELIAERQRRANYQNEAQGRFETPIYSGNQEFDIPQTKAEKKAAKKAQKLANKQVGYDATATKPKKHGCLIAFVTFIIFAAIIAYAALFALGYISQQSGVSKDEILARLAKPIQDFFQI